MPEDPDDVDEGVVLAAGAALFVSVFASPPLDFSEPDFSLELLPDFSEVDASLFFPELPDDE